MINFLSLLVKMELLEYLIHKKYNVIPPANLKECIRLIRIILKIKLELTHLLSLRIPMRLLWLRIKVISEYFNFKE